MHGSMDERCQRKNHGTNGVFCWDMFCEINRRWIVQRVRFDVFFFLPPPKLNHLENQLLFNFHPLKTPQTSHKPQLP